MRQFEGWGIALITKLKHSLTAKIFFITFLLLTTVCVLTYGMIAQLMPKIYMADQERLLADRTDWLVQQLEELTLDNCNSLLSQFTFQYNAPVCVQDADGRIVAGVDPSSGAIVRVDSEEVDYVVHCIEADVSFQNSNEKYQILVLGNTRTVNQAMDALSHIWPWLATAIVLVSVLTSIFYARFITRPIVRLSGISQRLSELDFSWRCGEKRSDELGTLARNLDELADRLSQAMEELKTANAALQEDIKREQQLEQLQREFFSAVSHELKTPITIIKGQLSGMLDGVGVYKDRDKYLAHSLAVVVQMEGLVQELLAVSRMDKAVEMMAPVELATLAQECVNDYNELFLQRKQAVTVDLPPEAWSLGERPLLKKAFGNLLSNAAFYSPVGGQIHVAVHIADEHILLTVENEGAHIAPELLPHLFEPFFRGDPSRNRQTGGSGLGLYLVQKIADQHGGSCTIQNSEKGVMATLELPSST